jgi:hypothetical protein
MNMLWSDELEKFISNTVFFVEGHKGSQQAY